MEIAVELVTIPYKKDTVINRDNSHILFHTKLTDFTGNPRLADMLRRIHLFWMRKQRAEDILPQILASLPGG